MTSYTMKMGKDKGNMMITCLFTIKICTYIFGQAAHIITLLFHMMAGYQLPDSSKILTIDNIFIKDETISPVQSLYCLVVSV